ncbi:hypothetical protein SAMN06265221_12251 [Paracoccus laeviglucosivorans]|uniref:Uncharacterized protein n=1 Tax=Paracoccus laeviglucosivorans TaxID=1197861 RepID=A0A521FGL2_9RHOB|nr:hypothetical protein SAMN06265221_12251 [Paracoccus laeviglucosivorans]
MIKTVILCLLILIALALVAGPGMRKLIAKLLGIRWP